MITLKEVDIFLGTGLHIFTVFPENAKKQHLTFLIDSDVEFMLVMKCSSRRKVRFLWVFNLASHLQKIASYSKVTFSSKKENLLVVYMRLFTWSLIEKSLSGPLKKLYYSKYSIQYFKNIPSQKIPAVARKAD